MTRLDDLLETPSQTAGPDVHIGLIPHQAGFEIFARPFSHVMADADTPGERIRIEGRVLDGLGAPCRDVLLEAWQANAAGCCNHPADRQETPIDPGFRGWGRIGTDFTTGLFTFETVKPGPVPGRSGHRPPCTRSTSACRERAKPSSSTSKEACHAARHHRRRHHRFRPVQKGQPRRSRNTRGAGREHARGL